MAVAADIVRPSLRWFAAGGAARGVLVPVMSAARDPAGFARLRQLCDDDPGVCAPAGNLALYRSAVIAGAKGGGLEQITVGDIAELLTCEAGVQRRPAVKAEVFYRLLRTLGVISDAAPATLRQLRAPGQRTPAELVDRYQLACGPVRDLLVGYLSERQPALDYSSLEQLAYILGKLFWADLERHNPGIASLRLSQGTAREWKQRLQVKSTRTVTGDGFSAEVTASRINFRDCMSHVRAFYLDLAEWAIEDPARWAQWAAPCPVRADELQRRKTARHRKSRMDDRTRQRLPALPLLVSAAGKRKDDAAALLAAASAAQPGQAFTAAGQTLTRSVVPYAAAAKVWAAGPGSGQRRDLGQEDDYAFWSWAVIEVLRLTGIRIEELLELSHHSLVQYRLPGTGELVPLLQIAPSKTDAERLLLVSPELADVLAAIIGRVRGRSGAMPLVPGYDRHECRYLPPSPLLFQRRHGRQDQQIGEWTIRRMLTTAMAHASITSPAGGQPLRYTPHDFRRLFITDAVMNGLPPHIAQVIAGHRDINVTMGYKAVYPDEAIQAHLAFLARRRALRPGEEYRIPTDAEWQDFFGHFERRKVATGTCGRAFGTPCHHEHACLRCPMHWPDPAQRSRIADIRDNLIARIAEAEQQGWPGEIEGLKTSLAAADGKLAQIDRRPVPGSADLGMPGRGSPALARLTPKPCKQLQTAAFRKFRESETGCGAFTLTPRLVVQVCRNGLTITRDSVRAVHLGERLDEGVVSWSGNTMDKTLALITVKTTDAVAAFLDPGYVDRTIRTISAQASHPLPDPQAAVEIVSQCLRFTDTQQAGILSRFIKGGYTTAGGILHAVTSLAQTLPDADTAHDLEIAALRALEMPPPSRSPLNKG